LRVNHEIRSPKVRVVNEAGEQLGILSIHEALSLAKESGLDLVEVVATAVPPVCKIVNFGKFRYIQTKRERESRKTQQLIKVKEVKVGPNISDHDLGVKIRQARDFLEKGNKVKVTCMFRGREITHAQLGDHLLKRVVSELEDVSLVEVFPKLFGKMLSLVLAPSGKKKKLAEKSVESVTSLSE
jgi:translation initiation factor IF-3